MSNKKIFGKKTFSDLLEEIYNNQKNKQNQINSLINELKPLITDIGDASLIVPLLKEYLEMGVKNDEHLIKLASIIQKGDLSDDGLNSNSILSEEEKQQLLEQAKKINEDLNK